MSLTHVRGSLGRAWGDAWVRWGFLASCLMTLGAQTALFLPTRNPLRDIPVVRWILTPEGTVLGTVVLLAGTVGLVLAWLRIRPREKRPTPPMRATLALWSVPLLLAPPLYSHDAYSYAAVGWMLDRGLNPYDMGPGSVSGHFSQQVDQLWLFTPTPYGPLAVEIQRWIVLLHGDRPYEAALGMRLMSLAGVALMLWALPRLAAWVGVRGEVALWWGVLNPLVIMHFVGGAHNDALMVGLVCLALWVSTRGAPWRSLVVSAALIAAAAAVKQPGAVALLGTTALCTARMHPHLPQERASLLPTEGEPWLSQAIPDLRRLLLPGLVAAAVFTAVFAGITAATGLGYGWIPALKVPGMVAGLSPLSTVGNFLAAVLTGLGFEPVAPFVQGFFKAVGTLLTLSCVLIASLRVLRIGGLAFTAWTLLALAVFNQTLHPWYILWGLPILPLAGMRPEIEKTIVWLTTGIVGYTLFDTATRSGQLVLGLAYIAVLVLIVRDSQEEHGDEEDHDSLIDEEPLDVVHG